MPGLGLEGEAVQLELDGLNADVGLGDRGVVVILLDGSDCEEVVEVSLGEERHSDVVVLVCDVVDWVGGDGCRLLQLNKDNEELREKRTTLEALLVLEREDMADLQKAHTDLQASLVEVATEKQQLVPPSPSSLLQSLLCSSLPHHRTTAHGTLHGTRHDTRHDATRAHTKWYRERTWLS